MSISLALVSVAIAACASCVCASHNNCCAVIILPDVSEGFSSGASVTFFAADFCEVLQLVVSVETIKTTKQREVMR